MEAQLKSIMIVQVNKWENKAAGKMRRRRILKCQVPSLGFYGGSGGGKGQVVGWEE